MPRLPLTSVILSLALGLLMQVAMVVASAPTCQAELIIQPASLMVSFDGKRPSGKFTLVNTEDKPARYRARAIHFRIKDDGGLDLVEPDSMSLAEWVRFNPTEFDLPPRGKRVVRYSILPPKDIEPGEYWGAIEFEPLDGVVQRIEDEEGRTFDITFVTTALAPIFGTKGDLRNDITLERAEVGTQEGARVLRLLVANAGLGRLHFTGNYQLADSQGGDVGAGELSKASMVILREGKRHINVPLGEELASGDYTLKLDLKVDEIDRPVQWERVIALN